MSRTTIVAVRVNPANPRHHLWNNNGTWFVHYTVHPTPLTKQRLRFSLGTKRIDEARRKRDRLLYQLAGGRDSTQQTAAQPVLGEPGYCLVD
ncbi:MAG: hypothetical protein ABSH21_02010 [Verrucomicrobiia bacterium]